MSDKELEAKAAYFEEQALLDISDDEADFSDPSLLNAERVWEDFEAIPPPTLVRQPSSFLGLTPRQRQVEFEGHTTRHRLSKRSEDLHSTRFATAPVADIMARIPASNLSQRPSSSPVKRALTKPGETPPVPNFDTQSDVPFYKWMGVVPRELKNGKNVKLAGKIRIESEHRQLLKGKIIYFYPPNDVSMIRRSQIHKVIQLGAAWVTTWRGDITHVMADEHDVTYTQILRHLNVAGLQRNVALVKFDPYIPECIQLGLLLDPTAGRFLVKGAPPIRVVSSDSQPPSPTAPPSSQGSLQIKASRRQLAAETSQNTTSVLDVVSLQPPPEEEFTSTAGEIVKDSFIELICSSSQEAAKFADPYNDALSKAIQATKAVAHLPLDEDEGGDSRPTSSAGQDSNSGTDEEESGPASKRSKMLKYDAAAPKAKKNQYAFQCMNPAGNFSSHNPNSRTIEVLDQMCKYYDLMQDQWRTLAYRKAIATLRKQDVKVTTANEAAALPFIGSRLAEKIEEIVLTNRLRRLDTTRDDPTDKLLRLFLGVYGVGLTQANKWVQAGHRTLNDLVAKAKLTDSQIVGIEHYNDFASRIPRSEVEAHGQFIRSALKKLNSDFEATIMGSYRRGAKDSGDIDIIITKAGALVSTLRDVVFQALVPTLFKAGFLKVKLATSSRTEDGTKWHGVCCLPSSKIWRRLDLLLVPEHEMGAALLYFTGNDIFNRSMRLLASKKGMRLNQRGLYKDVIRGKNREKFNEGTLVEGRDEKRIFEILGVPWREPTERIC